MNIRFLFFTLAALIGLTACGNDAPAAAQAEAEAEVARLDSINQLLETSIKEVEQDAIELRAALKELDALFPEEEKE